LEAEVVDLRKKVEKSKKLLNSSTILNEILDSQKSPNDKSGLGYKKEATHVEESTSKKHEVSPSLSKDGNNVASQSSTQIKESVGIGVDLGFNAKIAHQQNPNYRSFWKHL
jgi:hypothetical protein